MERAKITVHRFRNSLSRRLSVDGADPALKAARLAPPTRAKGQSQSLSRTRASTVAVITPTASADSADPDHDDHDGNLASGGGKDRRVSKAFEAKRGKILEGLSVSTEEYVDKSPKGSVDDGVRGLIELVSGQGTGWVTTSSCAGRVSVFVEGKRGAAGSRTVAETGEGGDGDGDDDAGDEGGDINEDEAVDGEEVEVEEDHLNTNGHAPRDEKIKTGPGGKGGGKWLFVSHDPVSVSSTDRDEHHFTRLFGLEPSTPSTTTPLTNGTSPPRLIHLSFSPLILHTLTASLHHARPLLAAAINAGFRESGVQSLRALEDNDAGVMVAIRTAGLVFESVIGVVVQDETGQERYQSLVSEEYLKMCMGVINERFEWNAKRRDRLIDEITRAVSVKEQGDHVEDKNERRGRKRAEGLQRQQDLEVANGVNEKKERVDESLDGGLGALDSK